MGLIEREGDEGLRMHRLVGAYVRQVSTDAEAQSAVEQVVIREAENMIDAPTLAPLNAFLPILRGVTDAALGREDERAATLCLWLGAHLRKLGSYASAQPYAEHALAIREQVLGSEHPATATSLNNLAINYYYQGDLAPAERLMRRALQIREARLGADHPNTQGSRQSLAAIRERMGDAEGT
ncbi:MAG: tetratricopeptide repeat protein [Candidatus Viridilinea halotolerans]|uniref:Tetratricopeptide repeat protein n=1 Tax=Candidatus Viridilinea halotolerans TaxID=2491704 RepID=A0A426UCD4_9CHLR|nr:MAG: tetratricopeptide repeat protein [Candidatus Viridilinea halotolerans]